MATLKAARSYLRDKIAAAFANPPAGYTVPIDATNILGYRSAPTPNSTSPNWLMVTSAGVRSEEDAGEEGVIGGGNEMQAQLMVVLFSRISESDDTAVVEASKAAAEDWLDDAEELLAAKFAEWVNEDGYWHSLTQIQFPRRDEPSVAAALSNQYRSSILVLQMELSNG